LIILGIAALYNADLLELFLAYFSHLLLDSLNSFGIMLFYPSNSRFVLFNLGIRVGSSKELVMNLIMIAIVSAYAYIKR